MTTTSASVMGNGEETPEMKAARIKANRQAGIEKARAAKALQHTKTESKITGNTNTHDEIAIWQQAYFIFLQTFQVRSEKDFKICESLANSVVRHFKELGKI
jgi:hypothetical protein